MQPTSARREVQFVIEKVCETAGYSEQGDATLKAAIPFAVWVWWPAEPLMNHPCRQAQHIYRLSPQSEEELRRLFGFREMPDACVCEHMGHVIE
jgi:hypothetical protein